MRLGTEEIGFLYVMFGYLCGSILFAKLFVKILCGEELEEISGDGNPGTANAFLAGGAAIGLLTLCLELGKGFLPVYLYCKHAPNPFTWMLPLVMAAPVAGHAFSIFSHGKGGKGIAVTFGSFIGIFPNWTALLLLAAVFVFFSLVLVISPHYYRTVAAFLLTMTLLCLLEPNRWIRGGVYLCSGIVLLRLFFSKEKKKALEVRFLGRELLPKKTETNELVK